MTVMQATQDAVRHLAANVESITAIVDAAGVDAADDYLSLRWQAVTRPSEIGRYLERIVLRLVYRDAVRQIQQGVACLDGFLAQVQALVSFMENGPGVLATMGRALATLGDDPQMLEVRRLAKARSLAGVLTADRVARGPARRVIHEAMNVVSELDALLALAWATVEHGWVFPEFDPRDGVVELHGLRHPALAQAVPTDLLFDGTTRVLAVTGPNMAGKSTLLKATGIAIYLAHAGCGVPAVKARLSRFDALVASLSVRDSLSSGESFYLSEVRRIKDLVNLLASTPRVVAIIDEPFKGTNVHDASDATALLLDGLCAQSASVVLLATHLSSVVRSRARDERLAAGFLGAIQSDSGVAFDYILREGISDQRLGMVLLEREGVVSALLSAIRCRGQVQSA
jgi:hypothetical protein